MDNEKPITRGELAQMLDSQAERITQQVTQQIIQQVVQQLKEYIDERTHDAETRLLRGFADYSDSAGIHSASWKPM